VFALLASKAPIAINQFTFRMTQLLHRVARVVAVQTIVLDSEFAFKANACARKAGLVRTARSPSLVLWTRMA